jgi:hypothetical protein
MGNTVDMNHGVELLIFNTQSVETEHKRLGRKAIAEAPTCPQVREGTWSVEEAKVFNLADMLKDWYENMIDDINVDRHGYVCQMETPNAAEEREFRQHLIQELTRRAFEQIDFEELARSIYIRLADTVR